MRRRPGSAGAARHRGAAVPDPDPGRRRRRRTCWCRSTSWSVPEWWRSPSTRGGAPRAADRASRRPSAAGGRGPGWPGVDGTWVDAAARALCRALRDAGDLLAGLREGAAADGVLLRPLRAHVLPAARAATGRRACCARACDLVGGLAVVFAFIGFVEYATKTIILNPKLVVQNDLHAYFTVNSVFFDPDIFGRFLALVMIGSGRGPALRAPHRRAAGDHRPCWPCCGPAWC